MCEKWMNLISHGCCEATSWRCHLSPNLRNCDYSNKFQVGKFYSRWKEKLAACFNANPAMHYNRTQQNHSSSDDYASQTWLLEISNSPAINFGNVITFVSLNSHARVSLFTADSDIFAIKIYQKTVTRTHRIGKKNGKSQLEDKSWNKKKNNSINQSTD
jgi:hypothetical protein